MYDIQALMKIALNYIYAGHNQILTVFQRQ